MFTIEILGEDVSVFLSNGEEIKPDHESAQDWLDIVSGGDSESACRYIMENYDIDWRIVKEVNGKIQNVEADEKDLQDIAETIYFESETDFSDVNNSKLYIIWEVTYRLIDCDWE